jgi:hypothetical protein
VADFYQLEIGDQLVIYFHEILVNLQPIQIEYTGHQIQKPKK